MKVIFDESFLSKASQLYYNLNITSYVFGNYYKEVSSVSELLNIDYYNGDIDKSSKYKITGGIWKENEKILKLNITIDNDKKEDLSERTPYFIYCFYNESYSNEEKIAFILCEELSKNDNIYQISPLNLSINSNLINIKFPTTTIANLILTQDDDTKFLENYGIKTGVNLFADNVVKNPDNTEELVSRESYFKYIRNTKTSGKSEILPFLNIYGEKVYNYCNFIQYKELVFKTENMSSNDDTYVDRSLSSNGGEIQLYGTFKRTKYFIENNVVIDQIDESGNLLNLDDVLIEVVSNDGLKFDIDYSNKRIIYEKNENPNDILSATFKLVERNYNPISGEIIEVTSNEIRLIQEAANSSWDLITKSPYKEDNTTLYLFSSDENEIQTFYISTNLILKEEDVKIESEDERVFDFFNISFSIDNDSNYRIKIDITTKQQNNSSENWNPYVQIIDEEGEMGPFESTLIKVKLVVKESKEENFYLVQGPKIGSLDLYQKISNNIYTKITEGIYLTSEQSVTLFPGKNDNKEINNYWVVISSESEGIDINPETGLLNSWDPSSWDNSNTPTSFSLYTTKTAGSISDIFLGDIVFGRVSSEGEAVDLSNWKQSMYIGKCTLPVYLKGETPEIEVLPNIVTLNELGCYLIYVKSNCQFVCSINNTNEENCLVSLTTDIEHTSYFQLYPKYNSNTGIPIYIYLLRNEYGEDDGVVDVGTMSIFPFGYSGEESYEVEVPLKLNPITGTIDYYSNNDKYIYLPTEDFSSPTKNKIEIQFKCNKSSMHFFDLKPGGITEYGVSSSNELVDITERVYSEDLNRGYNYSTIPVDITTYNKSNWPAKYIGTWNFAPTGSNYKPSIYYYMFKLGPSPSIVLNNNPSIDNLSITLKPQIDSYIDFYVNSILPIYDTPKIIYNLTYVDIYENNITIIVTSSGVSSELYKYLYRIRTKVPNNDSITKYIGSITISSEISPENFINEESEVPSEIPLPDYDKNTINSIVSPVTKTINIYQEGIPNQDSIEITEENNYFVDPLGGYKNYNITAPNGYRITTTNNTPDFGSITINTELNKIKYLVNSIDYYSEINLYENGEVNLKDYINQYNDRTISFDATISVTTLSGLISKDFNIDFLQSGFNVGLVYSSSSQLPIMEFGDIVNKTINLLPNDTSVSFYLGIFKDWPYLAEEDFGDVPEIISEDPSLIINEVYRPIFRSGLFNPIENNITVSFPKNTTANKVTRYLNISFNNSKANSYSNFYIILTQDRKTYSLFSSVTVMYFHSSGHGIMSEDEIDVIDPSLETDLPRERIGLKFSNSIYLEDWELVYIGPSTNFDNLTKYKLYGRLRPNKGENIISGTITLYDTETEEEMITWNVKQGYLNLYVEYNGKKISGDGSVGSLQDPINVPAESNISGNRVIFPFRASNKEYKLTGELETVEFDPNNFEINVESGYSPIWTSFMGNINNIFTSYESKYVIIDSQYPDDVPFIEQSYETSQGYVSQEVPFTVIINMFANYSNNPLIINEKSPNYNFTFFMKKLAKEN